MGYVRLFKTAVALALFIFFFNLNFVEARSCRGFFADIGLESVPGYSQSKLTEHKSLKVVTWNLLNLKIPDVEISDGSRAQKKWSKSDWDLVQMGRVVRELDADIYVFQEVFSIESLRHFVKNYMDGEYQVYLERGNDERGIQVGFAVKKSLDVDVELQSHREIKYEHNYGVYPAGTPVFARDLPALYLRQKDGSNSRASDDPDLIVLGAHFKSKRPTDGDFESTNRRAMEAETAAKIVTEINNRHNGKVPLVLAGDFNTQIMSAKEAEPLRVALKDSLSLMGDKLTNDQKVTHTYHPIKGKMHPHQVDAQLLNDNMAAKLTNSYVYRYKDDSGKEKIYEGKWESKIYPLTFGQRKKNPSDHMPIVSTYDMTR